MENATFTVAIGVQGPNRDGIEATITSAPPEPRLATNRPGDVHAGTRLAPGAVGEREADSLWRRPTPIA